MSDAVVKLLEKIEKIPTGLLFSIWLGTSIMLFIPEYVAQTLFVDVFRKQFGVWLGPSWIIVASILVAKIWYSALERRKSGISETKKMEALEKSLHNLTAEEKGYLLVYIRDQKNSVYVGLDDGIMGGLVFKSIVYRASNQGSVLDGFAFNLFPWASEYLLKHPELLDDFDGRPNTPREKNRRRLGM